MKAQSESTNNAGVNLIQDIEKYLTIKKRAKDENDILVKKTETLNQLYEQMLEMSVTIKSHGETVNTIEIVEPQPLVTESTDQAKERTLEQKKELKKLRGGDDMD